MPDTQRHARQTLGVSFAASLGFDRVSHVYRGGKHVLHDVSLTIAPGEVLCLLGPSGSGKSTLLSIACGIERQTSGRVLLNDREIAGPERMLKPEERSIGMVFQDYALFPHMTLIENVRYGLTKVSRGEGRVLALQALERVGLASHAERFPHALSGGEQQRVALARALAPRPAVLLLDEPFSGLDSRLRDQVRGDTLATLRESRATAVIVTHDSKEAMLLADRIALLNAGRLEQLGTMYELFDAPTSLFAASFFSPLNVFQVTAKGGRADTPLGSFPVAAALSGRTVDVGVRITGISAHAHCREGGGTVPARILSRRFLGDAEFMLLAVNGAPEPVQAQMPCGSLPASTRDAYLSVDPRAVVVFETGRSQHYVSVPEPS
ncbi:MAG: ABC transporter ATP-binding protein [Rhizobiaceae bacterium]|jgi:iron(III) transport system ATP-binding protein|nr:ABC transporter ATP-binding protein [Rhizobiaceae bacterium]